MSGLSFKQIKKAQEAKRRALGSAAQGRQHDLLAEPRHRVAPKPQLLPELAELLPPDTMLYLQESTPPSVQGMSLVQEGSATIRKGKNARGKLVIIKQTALTLDSGGRVREREVLERFCREVRVLRHTGVLYNDNIVDIVGTKWDASDEGQLLTIYLEYADFGNLAEFQSTHGEIRWSQKKKLCLDIAAGLSMLHDCGIFHGDLKPENVLIFCGPTPVWEDEWDEKDGFCAKLCDFGSSLFGIWSGEDTEVTLYGATPPFTAPEYDFQNKGRLPLRLLSPFDIYVFGLLVWRIARGGKTPLGILTSEQGNNEIRWLQDLKCSPDDQFLQQALNTLSSVPKNDRLFYERILKSTLRFKVEDRASTIKKMLDLLDSGDDESLPIIARWLQDLLRFPDDQFVRQGSNTLSSVPENCQSFCERIFESVLLLKGEKRASSIKKTLDLLESGELRVDDPLPIIAMNYPSGSRPELFLQPTGFGIVGADFGTMPELFTSPVPIPELHSSVFRSLESMSKDKSLDVAKRAQANFNAGISTIAGIGTTKSNRLALQYLTEAASLGQVNVRAIIYRLYEACEEVLPERVPFKDWIEDGVRSGSIIACEDLARLSQNDNPTEWIRAHYNEANGSNTSELFSSCRSGDLDTILAAQIAAQKSQNTKNDPDDSESNCIHYIVGHDHADLDNLIPALVSSGLLVDSQSCDSFQQAFRLPPYGYSSQAGAPLHWAISRNSFRAVAALVESGANPYLCNASDLSPAHVASFNHQDDLLQIMIALSRPQHVWKPSGYFSTSLMAQALKQTSFEHMVCTRGDPDSLFRVLRLLRNTVESEGVYDAELLSLAIESRRTDVLRFLLAECKINPNIYTVDPGGNPCWPLKMAVQSGHPALLDLLLEHGLDVHRIQLTWAVSSECSEHEINSVIERLVLLPDIDIDRPDRTGSYPLHIAIDYGKIDVVKCLLRLGADKELTISQESSQLTALGRLLHKASLKSAPSILELLLHPEEGMGQPSSHIVGPMNSLHAICSRHLSVRDDALCLSCFKILWESYSDEEKKTYLNDFNEAGQTPLHCAVFSGNFPCVDELVQLGADVNLKDRHGRRQSPLDIAYYLVSDKVLSHWRGEPSDINNYRQGMNYIIELLKLNGAVVENNPYSYLHIDC